MARSVRALFAFLLLGTVLTISQAPARLARAGSGVGSDTIAVAYDAAPASMDPAIVYDGAGALVMRAAYEGLVRMKGESTTDFEGVLATSWTSNANKTVWTFHLRHGVLFHDGTPFNAGAVKFLVTRTMAVNQAPAFILGQFMTPASVKVLDPYTVRFDLKAPAPRLLYAMASQWGNWIISPTAIMKHTVHNDHGTAWLATHEAVTGPYMFSEVVPNQSVTMVKFPQYWRGWSGRHAGKVVFTFVLQDATRRSLVEQGGADISMDFTPVDLVALKANPSVVVDAGYGMINVTLIPTEYGPFASAKARLALAYAFDYNGFINGLLKGFAQPAQGPLTRSTYGHDSTLPIFHTDLAKAKELFSEAGVKPGTTVTLMYQAQDDRQKDIAQVTQGQLAQLGINVQLEPRDGATYFTYLYGTEPIAQRPNLWAGGWFPDYNDAVDWLSPLYHTKDSSAGGAANGGMYHNAEVDRLLAQASATLDAGTRLRLLSRVQHILTVDDPAVVPIAEIPNTTVYRSSLHGYYYNSIYTLTYDYYTMWK